MDGPPEVNQVRAPKRPYPEEQEERQDVCCLSSLTQPSNLCCQNVKQPKVQVQVCDSGIESL